MVDGSYRFTYNCVSKDFLRWRMVWRLEGDRPIILSVPYDRRLPHVSGILRQHYNLLVERNPVVKQWMTRAPMLAYQRPPNLRDHLVTGSDKLRGRADGVLRPKLFL